MTSSNAVASDPRVPELANYPSTWEVLRYLTEVTTFALNKLDDWKYAAGFLTPPVEHATTELWESGNQNLTRVGEAGVAVGNLEDYWKSDAVIAAVQSTYATLERFCSYGLKLLSCLLQHSVTADRCDDLHSWCKWTGEDVEELLRTTLDVYELREDILAVEDNSASDARAAA